MAYNSLDDGYNVSQQQPQQQQQQPQQQQQQQQQPQQVQQKQQLQPQMQEPPPAMYLRQPGQLQPYPAASFWDRLINKRVEVFKFLILALIIVLGLAIHAQSTFYLENYINKTFVSGSQELMLRLSYPLMILVILWMFKAL